MYPYFFPFPQGNQTPNPFEKEYAKLVKKLMKKHFGEEQKKAEEKKKPRWSGVTKTEVVFIILALSWLWIPAYIGLISISVSITKQLLQGL